MLTKINCLNVELNLEDDGSITEYVDGMYVVGINPDQITHVTYRTISLYKVCKITLSCGAKHYLDAAYVNQNWYTSTKDRR